MTQDDTWTIRRLTDSPAGGTSHSYYDIPVFDRAGARILGHRLPFSGRHPRPDDAVEIGLVACNGTCPDNWKPLGESRAWSWQQGPMAQWIAGGPRVVWTDREAGRIVARLHDTETGTTRTLPGQIYAVDPAGRTALSLDMQRLDRLRPGYGYPPESPVSLPRKPGDDGVWAIDLDTGARRLLLSVERAVAFLNTRSNWGERLRRSAMRAHYWFNHVKISPDGTRFTVKLRWRRIGGPWDDRQGVSLTCGMDGVDLRLLASATSHVIWQDNDHLYFWQRDALRLFADTAPEGTPIGTMADDLVRANVHIRHLDAEGTRFVLDTPYREDVSLQLWNRAENKAQTIGTFPGHVPASGPFRCDLHPCPAPDGNRIALTSLATGRREIHLAERVS